MSNDQHNSPIKTPQQLISVIVIAFIVPVVVIVLLTQYVTGAKREGAGASSMTPEAIAERLKPVSTVAFVEAGGARTLQSGEAVYKLACAACHEAGVAGAPKTGDATAWSARIAQGYDTLVKHAVQGFKGMPAKGGNADLDPLEVARGVVFIANRSGAKFTEPAAPAAAPEDKAAATGTAAPAAVAAAPSVVIPAAAPRASAPTQVDRAIGEKIFKQACAACHIAGVAGAPKVGDKAAWAPRIKLGVDALTGSVIKGKGAMPPRGGAASASDAELKAAVEYVVSQAK